MVEQRTNGNVSYSVEKDKGRDAEVEVEMNCKSGNGSYDNVNHDPDPFADIPEKGVECELAVKDTQLKKVALGRVFKAPTQASTCHGRAFGAEELRVCIDVVIEYMEDTPLPLPTEEHFTIGEAIGSFVQWPRNLVSLRYLEVWMNLRKTMKYKGEKSVMSKTKCKKRKRVDESTNSKKVESAKSKTNDPVAGSNNTLKALLEQKYDSRRFLSKVVSMMGETQVTDVQLSEDVVGRERRLRLAKEDITALLNMEKISLPVIQTFVGYLSSVCDMKTYGFLCPEMTSQLGILWMLVVIDIVEHNQVYWFDSIGNSVPSMLRTLINTSVRAYGYTGGSRKSSQAPQWVKVDCARQPSAIECGYYIMRYMLEIVTRPNPMATINEVRLSHSPVYCHTNL
ncbi:uncharacterized protein LOC141648859 [Silene latifolia]|uniref:uncharacterized protein LOC141648859 n=1 Tax=Silene latifolia TaxID=37657 RepID=UPI003D77E187